MSEDQNTFAFDEDFDQLLNNLSDVTDDRSLAMSRFKEHLWALVLITERRLNVEGIKGKQAYQLACRLIAEIAHYQGGECRYLPRGDKLKQELRDIQMFRLWHEKSWPVERIHKEYCPELNTIQVYKILRIKRKEYVAKIQPTLL